MTTKNGPDFKTERARNARRRVASRGASPDDYRMMRRMRRIAEENGFLVLPRGVGLVGFKVIPAPPVEDDKILRNRADV